MNLKKLYRRFRAWQLRPRRYTGKKMECHHCPNCGHEFEGNNCPLCGQAAGDGLITWKWVGTSIMNLWAMDSRSMPYSLLQLMLRPGYFISEFISGHRQVSYPPVSMLFGVAVVYAVLSQLLGWDTTSAAERLTDRYRMPLTIVIAWLIDNPGWGTMSVTMIMILPVWILFRYAPRHPRHSLPEGIFIQIFMANIFLICIVLSEINFWFTLLFPFYFYITYRQLFGYRFWGTVWRLSMCLFFWMSIAIMIMGMIFILDGRYISFLPKGILYLSISSVILVILLAGCGWIGKRTEKRRLQKPGKQA